MNQNPQTTDTIDPKLSIGAARQAAVQSAAPAVENTTAPKEHLWHTPRRLIGPDLIKALRDFSQGQTGSRQAFDYCVVQMASDGRPASEIDVNDMRLQRNKQEFTYGQLIGHSVT